MKASTFLKILIAVAVVGVIAYVVYNNNKAAEINNLVSNPTAPYKFPLHVDSVCDNLARVSDLSNAKSMFDGLYEEIDVYANIKDSTGDYIIEQPMQENLYAQAFQAYFPKIEDNATTLFGTVNWSPANNQVLKKEVERMVDGNIHGITQSQKNQLVNYRKYFKQYYNFRSLLNRLEECTDSLTYRKLSELRDYDGYPYSNLQSFQNRKSRAKESARSNWATYLGDQKRDLMIAGRNILVSDEITDYMRRDFHERVNNWIRKASQFENTVPNAEDKYSQEKEDLQNLYEQIAKKQREQEKNRNQRNYPSYY